MIMSIAILAVGSRFRNMFIIVLHFVEGVLVLDQVLHVTEVTTSHERTESAIRTVIVAIVSSAMVVVSVVRVGCCNSSKRSSGEKALHIGLCD